MICWVGYPNINLSPKSMYNIITFMLNNFLFWETGPRYTRANIIHTIEALNLTISVSRPHHFSDQCVLEYCYPFIYVIQPHYMNQPSIGHLCRKGVRYSAFLLYLIWFRPLSWFWRQGFLVDSSYNIITGVCVKNDRDHPPKFPFMNIVNSMQFQKN